MGDPLDVVPGRLRDLATALDGHRRTLSARTSATTIDSIAGVLPGSPVAAACRESASSIATAQCSADSTLGHMVDNARATARLLEDTDAQTSATIARTTGTRR